MSAVLSLSLSLSPPFSLSPLPLSTTHTLLYPSLHSTHTHCRIPALDCGQSPSLWLSRVLNRHCRLVRQSPDHQRQSKSNHRYLASGDTISSSLSLANEAQYLLVSDASVKQLLRDIQQSATAVDAGELTVESLTKRFRPNLVLSANVPPYAEETWEMLRIGKTRFKVGRSSVAAE